MRPSLIIYMCIGLILFMFFQHNDVGTDIVLKNMSDSVYNSSFGIVERFEYTNLYENEPTVTNMILNIINPIIYTIVAEVNTVIPLITRIMAGEYAWGIIKIIILITILYLLIFSIELIKMGIIVYFFFKEKKKTRIKIYQ